MTDLEKLTFLAAQNHHIGAIREIHNSHVRGKNSSNYYGFLLAQTTDEEILQASSHATQYFVAVNSTDEVLGFLALSQPKISEDFFSQIAGEAFSYKEKLLSDRHFYIQIVAAKPDCMGKGIARFMYRSLYDLFPEACFSTFIVSKPLSNDRSLGFHQKQGFIQIGTLKRDRFMEWKNYESILMFKEPEKELF